MVELQIISKVLETGDYSLLEDNYITEDYFKDTGYEEEFAFIQNHYKQYGNVPDKATFLAKFKDIELVEVTESDRYLVDTIREEYQFRRLVPVVNKVAELADTDANSACEYMMQAIKDLQPNYQLTGVDLIQEAIQRLEHYKERVEKSEKEGYKSTLMPLVSAMMRYPGFKYKSNELEKIAVYEFLDTVRGSQIYVASTALLQGSYSGMIDTSKIPKKEFDWMRSPDN